MKCPECDKENKDNYPLEIDGEIKDGGCQDCWEKECSEKWWDACDKMDSRLILVEGE